MKRPDPLGLSGSSDETSPIARATRLREAGDLAGAIAAFRQVGSDPSPYVRATALFQVGAIMLHDFGDPRSAIPTLREALELGQPDVGPLAALDLAEAYETNGQLSLARETLQWVWELDHPRYSAIAAIAYSRLLLQAGETEQARHVLSDTGAGSNKPWAALAHKALAELEDAAGNQEVARAEYELALRMGVEGAPEVRVALAELQARSGAGEEARRNYERALAEGVDNPANVRYLLASLQFQGGHWSEALKNYEIVWQSDDDEFAGDRADQRPHAAGVLAQLYKKAGDLAAARQAAQYAVDKGSDRVAARAMCFLAALDAADGRDETARKTFGKALRRAAGRFDLPEARLGLARLDERRGHLEAALQGYEQFMQTQDLSLRSSVTFAKGRVLAKLGDLAGARAAYEAALEGPISERLRKTVSEHLKALAEGEIASHDDGLEEDQPFGSLGKT